MCRQSEFPLASPYLTPPEALWCNILLSSALLSYPLRIRDKRACAKSGNPRALGRSFLWFTVAILALASGCPPTTTGSALDRGRQRLSGCHVQGAEARQCVNRGTVTNIVAITRLKLSQLAVSVVSRLHRGGRSKSQKFFDWWRRCCKAQINSVAS